MKSVAVLGATGSIGRQTLDVIAAFPEQFRVRSLAAHTQVQPLADAARQFGAEAAVIGDPDRWPDLRDALAGSGIRALAGQDGLCEVATDPEADTVVAAMVGAAGLRSLLAAAHAGKTIALANKEPIVAAGQFVLEAVAAGGATLIPVDSEPSAIFQCLQGQDRGGLARIILTASGGALRNLTDEELARVTPEQALKHPTWSMGPKITVDSATLMNKGLELIEAHWLFGVQPANIDIIIHPQSIVHSLVEFADGSLLAQLGVPTMRTPIQYALGYPARLPHNWAPLDLAAAGTLTFATPDFSRFPALGLAREAIERGGSAPAVLNAANEVAVEAFLRGAIGFTAIADAVRVALDGHVICQPGDAEDVLAVDAEARRRTWAWVEATR